VNEQVTIKDKRQSLYMFNRCKNADVTTVGYALYLERGRFHWKNREVKCVLDVSGLRSVNVAFALLIFILDLNDRPHIRYLTSG
jgi:hypothetical protein